MKQNRRRLSLGKKAALWTGGVLAAGAIGYAGAEAVKLGLKARAEGKAALEEARRSGKQTKTTKNLRHPVSITRPLEAAPKKFILTETEKTRLNRALNIGFGMNVTNSAVDRAAVEFIFNESTKLGISPKRVLDSIYFNRDFLSGAPRIRQVMNARDSAIKKGDKAEAERCGRIIDILIDLNPTNNPVLARHFTEVFVNNARRQGYSAFNQAYIKGGQKGKQ